MDFNTVLSVLPNLSKQELTDLKARINFLLDVGTKEQSDGNDNLLFMTILDVLRTHGVDYYPQQTRNWAGKDNETFKEKVPMVIKYFGNVSRTELSALLTTGVRLLLLDVQSWMTAPINPIIMMRNVHRIPEIMNKNFPSYAENGLLALLVRGKETT